MRTLAIALILVVLAIAIAVAAWMLSRPEPLRQPDALTLPEDMALFLLRDELWQECLPQGISGSYVSCEAEVEKRGDRWLATVTYDGLYDDSVRASRTQAVIARRGGLWVVESVLETQLCRWREVFSADICV